MAPARSRFALISLLTALLVAGALSLMLLSQRGSGDSRSGVAEPTPTNVPADSRLTFGSPSDAVPGDFGSVLIDLSGRRWLAWLGGEDAPYGAFRAEVVALSPDGSQVIFNDGKRLLAASLAGDEVRELARGEGLWAAFSADGRTLAILKTLPPRRLTMLPWPDGEPIEMNLEAQTATWVSNTLAVRTLEGAFFVSTDGQVTPMRCDADFGNPPPASQPLTGRQTLLAFWTTGSPCAGAESRGLYLVEPGGEPRFIADIVEMETGQVQVHAVSLSADGTLLAVALVHPLTSPEHAYAFDSMEVSVIEVATGRTGFTIPKSGFHVMSWSPTENILLFDRDSCRPPEWQLTLINGDGSDMRPLADPSLGVKPMFHAWSPDGRRIAVVSNAGVSLIDVETGVAESIPLTVDPPLFGVSWMAPNWLSVFAGGGTDFCP